ncbi:MAG: DUF2878 family protein [Candidatus Paceibacterota bacterium]|jgi:uncharacterized membrane protein YoaT (DUF817 family)
MSGKNRYRLTNIFAVISLTSVAVMWRSSLMVFAVLLVMAVLMLSIERSKEEVKTFLLCSIFGSIAEYIAISLGAWTYENPDVFNIPIWLPLLWGIASVFIVRVYKNFSK